LKPKTAFSVLVVACFLLMLTSVCVTKSQGDPNTAVSVIPAQTSIQVGKTFTVNITLSNVANLYGLDVTLDYNSSILQLVGAKPDGNNLTSAVAFLGTNSIPGGVLYGSPVTNDTNSIDAGGLYYNTSLSTTNEYHIFATSVNQASSFNGSGTIASLTFSVLNSGHSDLTLSSALADHPGTSETTSEEIPHLDNSASVDVGQVPEFSAAVTWVILAVAITSTLMLMKKEFSKKREQALK
jgi:hypothetical protein